MTFSLITVSNCERELCPNAVAVHVVVLVDLDRRVWSMKADGESWVEETPFPDSLPKGSSISSLDFGSRAGLGDKPDAAFAIGNVKMTRATPIAP